MKLSNPFVKKAALSEAGYYKLKARVLELTLDQERLQQAQAMIAQKRQIAFQDAGLDPTKNYTLVDETHSVREVATVTPAQI